MIEKLLIKFVHCCIALRSCCINLCVILMKEYKCIYFVINGIILVVVNVYKKLSHNQSYF